MITLPPYMLQALEAGGRVVSRCDILSNGAAIRTNVPVAAGTVRLDRGSFSRRTCDLVITDPALVPFLAADPLNPYGTELRLFKGVVLPDGSEAVVPVGTFVVWTATRNDPFDGVRIAGYDRAKLVQTARFPYPRNVPAESLLGRLNRLALEAVPWGSAIISGSVPDWVTAAGTYNRDRDAAITELSTAVGAEFYADPWGNFVTRPIPDLLTADPAWTIDASYTMVSAARSVSRDGVRNAIVASGTSTGTVDAATALVSDDDPWSPTYYGGQSLLTGRTFGQIPGFYSSPSLLTSDQCRIAAAGILRDTVGLRQTVTIGTVANPALEPGDVIKLRFPDGRVQQHLAESWSLDLGPAGMEITTRTVNYRDVS